MKKKKEKKKKKKEKKRKEKEICRQLFWNIRRQRGFLKQVKNFQSSCDTVLLHYCKIARLCILRYQNVCR